jgi:hypothetical protein
MQKNHLCKLGFQALFTILAIMGAMKKEYAHQASIVLPLLGGEFDQKNEITYDKMAVKVFNVLCPFLGYAFKPFFGKKLITCSL